MHFNTLSGRFLGLLIVFVMIAEVLIFVPAVSRFRVENLQNRLELGQLAALALLATPDVQVAPDLEAELLATADVYNVALRREGVRELALQGEVPGVISACSASFRPASRARIATTAASVPPALSPAIASRAPSRPSAAAPGPASHCSPAQASSTAVGKRCSGASR